MDFNHSQQIKISESNMNDVELLDDQDKNNIEKNVFNVNLINKDVSLEILSLQVDNNNHFENNIENNLNITMPKTNKYNFDNYNYSSSKKNILETQNSNKKNTKSNIVYSALKYEFYDGINLSNISDHNLLKNKLLSLIADKKYELIEDQVHQIKNLNKGKVKDLELLDED